MNIVLQRRFVYRWETALLCRIVQNEEIHLFQLLALVRFPARKGIAARPAPAPMDRFRNRMTGGMTMESTNGKLKIRIQQPTTNTNVIFHVALQSIGMIWFQYGGKIE
jgi:hypothetical protein